MSAVREFVDATGQPWRVYAVSEEPTHATSRRFLPPSYQRGWLVFESPKHKFRLAPVPEGWEHAPLPMLLSLLGVASRARSSQHDDAWPGAGDAAAG